MILKASSASGAVVLGLADDIFAVIRVDAVDRRHVERAGQIVDDRVEQRLHAFVLEGGAAQHREEGAGDHGLADQLLEGGLVGHLAFEVGGGRVIVEFEGRFDHLIAVFLGLIEHVGGNVDVLVVGAERFIVPDHAFHANQIDDALEILLGTDRELDGDGLGAKPGLDVLHRLEEVGADLVHLVGEDDARHFVFIALTPDRLGLRLDALIAVEHDDGAVEHAQRAFDFDGEIDVAGSVDDVEALFLPERGGRGRGDGDAALLLLLHEIHGRSAVMHFADLVALAGVIEDPLRGRGFPGIDVGHDAEIAVVLDWVDAGHLRSSP